MLVKIPVRKGRRPDGVCDLEEWTEPGSNPVLKDREPDEATGNYRIVGGIAELTVNEGAVIRGV